MRYKTLASMMDERDSKELLKIDKKSLFSVSKDDLAFERFGMIFSYLCLSEKKEILAIIKSMGQWRNNYNGSKQ